RGRVRGSARRVPLHEAALEELCVEPWLPAIRRDGSERLDRVAHLRPQHRRRRRLQPHVVQLVAHLGRLHQRHVDGVDRPRIAVHGHRIGAADAAGVAAVDRAAALRPRRPGARRHVHPVFFGYVHRQHQRLLQSSRHVARLSLVCARHRGHRRPGQPVRQPGQHDTAGGRARTARRRLRRTLLLPLRVRKQHRPADDAGGRTESQRRTRRPDAVDAGDSITGADVIPGRKYTPEDILRLAWYHKWLMIAGIVVFATAAAVVAKRLPNEFKSETLILVIPQRIPDSYVRSTVTMRIEERLRSLSQEIFSRTRLETVISEFDLYPELRKTRPMESVVEYMRTKIVVDTVRDDAFKITYTAGAPRTAMIVTDRLASMFIDENTHDRSVMADSTNQFLESQLDDSRA